MKTSRKLANLLLVFALVYMISYWQHGTNHTIVSFFSHLIPLGHLLELFVSSTTVIILYLFIINHLLPDKLDKQRRGLLFFCISIVAVYLLGAGMHFAANSISHFVNKIGDTGELKNVVHFYDEYLSHLIGIPPIILMPLSISMWSFVTKPVERSGYTQSLIAGVLFGLMTAIVALEGKVGHTIALPISIVALGLWYRYRKKVDSKDIAVNFDLAAYAAMAVALIIWGIVYQGFPEPIGTLPFL